MITTFATIVMVTSPQTYQPYTSPYSNGDTDAKVVIMSSRCPCKLLTIEHRDLQYRMVGSNGKLELLQTNLSLNDALKHGPFQTKAKE